MMNLQELQTLIGLKIPAKFLFLTAMGAIPSDNRRATILMVLKLVGPQSGVTFPNFESIASGFELAVNAQTSGVCESQLKQLCLILVW